MVPLAVLGLISMGWPAYARALTREWGLVEPAEATLYLTAAWIAWRHAVLLGPRAPDARCFRFVAFFCGVLALEEMDWLGVVGPLVGRIGAANVYLGSSHDLLKVAWHYHWFAIPLALSALLVLGMVWYRGYLTVGFIRREMFDPTTLPLYGALLGPGGGPDARRGRHHPERAPSVLPLPAGGALRAPVRAPPGERPAAQVLPRLAPGGPPPGVMRPGAVVGSRP